MYRKFISTENFYPPDAPGAGSAVIPSGDLTKQGIEDFLNQDDKEEAIPLDDDKKDKKDKKDVKTDEEEDEKTAKLDKETDTDDDKDEKLGELDEIEDELEEPDDEKLELVTPVRRKEILTKYPKLFKDFPYLEKAYYREQAFTAILPTIDDAKEAVAAKDTLDSFERDLSSGNIETMLMAAKNASPKAFDKIADNYMSVLSKVDEKAFHHVVGTTIKQTIMAMAQESKSSGSEALLNAAQLLNQFVFGKSTFEAPKNLSSDDAKDTKADELSEREQKFTRQRLDSSVNDLNVRVNNAYKATIENNIDPNHTMTDYVRKNASREALESLEAAISSDTRFRTLTDKLWDRAIKNDFDKDLVDTIRRAFLSKAKTVLPSIIKKARNEALRGMNKKVIDDKEDVKDDDKSPKRDQEHKSQSRSKSDTKSVPKGMSTLEYIMQDD